MAHRVHRLLRVIIAIKARRIGVAGRPSRSRCLPTETDDLLGLKPTGVSTMVRESAIPRLCAGRGGRGILRQDRRHCRGVTERPACGSLGAGLLSLENPRSSQPLAIRAAAASPFLAGEIAGSA